MQILDQGGSATQENYDTELIMSVKSFILEAPGLVSNQDIEPAKSSH
jgi:hypothetical protein